MKILSIDLGASKCEINLAISLNNNLNIEKVGEFSGYLNNDLNYGYIWDIDKIMINIKKYIEVCINKYNNIDYLVTCSWGLDYIMFDHDDNIMYPCYSYRNNRTQKYFVNNNLIQQGVVNCENLTYYQLKSEKDERIQNCKFLLSISDGINYLLTGKKYWNYSLASTTGLLNIKNKQFDVKILKELNIIGKIPPLINYGEILGSYKNIKIINGLSHDTAAAVYSINNLSKDEAYLICGTWCIIGINDNRVESDNIKSFTNELGYKNIRFLKNTIGLWLIQQLSKVTKLSYSELEYEVKNCEVQHCEVDVDKINLEQLTGKNNSDIIDNINSFFKIKRFETKYIGFYVKIIYKTLVNEFKKSLKEIEEIKKIKINKLHVIGGGCKSKYFMNLLEKTIDIPIEVYTDLNSSIGNINFILNLYFQ